MRQASCQTLMIKSLNPYNNPPSFGWENRDLERIRREMASQVNILGRDYLCDHEEVSFSNWPSVSPTL